MIGYGGYYTQSPRKRQPTVDQSEPTINQNFLLHNGNTTYNCSSIHHTVLPSWPTRRLPNSIRSFGSLWVTCVTEESTLAYLVSLFETHHKRNKTDPEKRWHHCHLAQSWRWPDTKHGFSADAEQHFDLRTRRTCVTSWPWQSTP